MLNYLPHWAESALHTTLVCLAAMFKVNHRDFRDLERWMDRRWRRRKVHQVRQHIQKCSPYEDETGCTPASIQAREKALLKLWIELFPTQGDER